MWGNTASGHLEQHILYYPINISHFSVSQILFLPIINIVIVLFSFNPKKIPKSSLVLKGNRSSLSNDIACFSDQSIGCRIRTDFHLSHGRIIF